jgi:succinate dehydrogenase / fumarate reductase cytochrome b subunit
MTTDTNRPAAHNWWKWFDPRGRDFGTWGFILNRITAIGLTVYLFLHLIVLSTLASGPDAYEQFLEIIHNPLFIAAELLVVIAGLYHGINGIRIVLNSFGVGIASQKALLAGVVALTLIGSVYFALVMFS